MPKRHLLSRKSSKQLPVDEQPSIRAVRKKSSHPIFKWKNIFLASALTLFLLSLLGIGSLFSVKHIVVAGAEQIDGIDSFEQAFLPFLSENDVAAKLATSYPEFDDISVVKDYPDRLVIRVSRATPVVQLKTVGGAYVLDRIGRIIEKKYDPLTSTHLPMIQTTTPLYIGKMKLGATAPVDGIDTAVQTVLALRKVGISVDAVAIQNPTMIVLNSDAMQLVVSDEKELERQLWELTEVVSRSRKKGVSLASVDVRFSKPVITLAR